MVVYPIKAPNRMRTANRVLLGAALLFALVWIGHLYIGAIWYEALYWAAQSALIGSVADWFAVTALFRKPLGFPYHTALIPRHKQKLIQAIVKMVDGTLLSKKQCTSALENIHLVDYLDAYLMKPGGREQLRRLLGQTMLLVWQAKTHEEWSVWGAQKLRQFLSSVSLVGPLQQYAIGVCQRNEHEDTVCAMLQTVQQGLRTYEAERWLTAVFDQEVDRRRREDIFQDLLFTFGEAVDVVNTQDMARAVLAEMDSFLGQLVQKGSRERQALLRQWVEPLQSLAGKSSVRDVMEEAWVEWVRTQDWETIIQRYICPHIDALLAEDTESEKNPAVIMESSIHMLWLQYRDEPGMREQLEDHLHRGANYIIEHSHGMLGTVVRQILEEYDEEKFIRFVEEKVNNDLAWIRINGAVIGALAGLGFWVIIYGLYLPLLRYIGWY